MDKCRVCGCTDDAACPVGCSWREPGLCSVCADAVTAIQIWKEGARRANWTALVREVFDGQ